MEASEWDQARDDAPRPARRAAMLLWISGAVISLLFGSCAGLTVLSGMIRVEDLPPDTPQQFVQMHPTLFYVAAALAVLGLLPGLGYLALGLGVRRGRPFSVRLALVLAATQAIVLTVMLANSLLGAVTMGDPVAMTLAVVVLGTPLLLLGFAIYWLLAAQRTIGRDDGPLP